MKHRFTAPFFAVLVLALAAFTGSAFAGGGQGNGSGGSNGNSANAPGQQTQAPAAAPAPAAAQAPAAAPAPAKADHSAKPANSKQSSKQSPTSSSAPATGGSNANGVKPSNTTKHDTYAKASSDQTKKYGNGKTAGQIATQAGYGDATLHGPGNSQPHKVLCGGHEVDVHALAHKGNKCGSSSPQTPTPAATNDAKSASTCETTTQTVTQQVLVGVKHMIGPKGSGRYVLIHPNTKSAHYSKHADDVPVYETVTKTVSTPTSANCESTKSTVVTTSSSVTPSSGVAPATATAAAGVAPATAAPAAGVAPATAAPAAGVAPATATPSSAGGVKGAAIALRPTKTKPAGGVLGTTTRLGGTIASTRLPFTGLPLWIFALVAAGLIGIGVTLRRTSAANRI